MVEVVAFRAFDEWWDKKRRMAKVVAAVPLGGGWQARGRDLARQPLSIRRHLSGNTTT